MCQALPKIFEIQCKLAFKELEIFIAANLHIKLRSPAISFAPLAWEEFVNDVEKDCEGFLKVLRTFQALEWKIYFFAGNFFFHHWRTLQTIPDS